MSDQGKWFKLWGASLTDPSLENLELHQWARWARLGVFIKVHGTDGKLVIEPPARSLQNALRTSTYEELILIISNLPSFAMLEMSHKASPIASQDVIKESKSYMLTCKNWNKYQGDFSIERTKKWREKNSVTDSVTRDGKSDGLRREEKRRDVKSTSTSTPSATKSRAVGRALSSQEHPEESVDEMPIKDTRKEWLGKLPEVKSYEDAKDDELCGPPKDLLKRVKGLK